jgi:hypothetical protein
MEQTSGLIVIGWKLAVAVIAGIPLLTTIGVYLLARFTHVFDAYAGERAKLLAQFHNLDRLVEQTEKLTETTKLIESRVSYDLWDRQMRSKVKLDYYQSFFRVLSDLKESTYELMWSQELAGSKPSDRISWYLNPTEKDQHSGDVLKKANVELRHLLMFGELVVGEGGHKCLETIQDCVKSRREDLGSGEHMRSFYERLEAAIPKANDEAKADLGYGSVGR